MKKPDQSQAGYLRDHFSYFDAKIQSGFSIESLLVEVSKAGYKTNRKTLTNELSRIRVKRAKNNTGNEIKSDIKSQVTGENRVENAIVKKFKESTKPTGFVYTGSVDLKDVF